jgi:aspartate kinase
MIIQKYGGTSVGGAEPIRRLAEIVRSRLAREPVVVVSALSGVTNRLFRLTELAVTGTPGAWETELHAIEGLHRQVLGELGLDAALVDPVLAELADLARGIALVRERTPRTLDHAASFGERLSSRIVAAHLAQAGIPSVALDAWDAGLVTDDRFGAARPLPGCDEAIRKALLPAARTSTGTWRVPVITGYVAKSRSGEITTLGRGGSDYSAAIFGAAIGAEEIQVWKDVDGVMTADPRIVPEARHVRTLSFAEAAELAFFGAKVLHPATMAPAVAKDIPIRVLNSFRPEQPGTSVVARPEADAGKAGERSSPVRSIAHKDHIAVVNVVAAPMMLQFGFLEKVAEVFARHEIVVDMIATTEVSLALSTEPGARLEPAVAELSTFAEASIVRDLSLVSVVGEGLREKIDPCATVLATLAELGVRVEMISYGATRNNLSVVIPGGRVREVVAALHGRLFEG